MSSIFDRRVRELFDELEEPSLSPLHALVLYVIVELDGSATLTNIMQRLADAPCGSGNPYKIEDAVRFLVHWLPLPLVSGHCDVTEFGQMIEVFTATDAGRDALEIASQRYLQLACILARTDDWKAKKM